MSAKVCPQCNTEYGEEQLFCPKDGSTLKSKSANADLVGSTEFIIDQVRAAQPGSSWAIGTEIHLVHRLALEHPEQRIRSLQKNVCPCATMNRIDPAHLLWALENLADGHVVNPVRVRAAVKRDAKLALDGMLALHPRAGAAPVERD